MAIFIRIKKGERAEKRADRLAKDIKASGYLKSVSRDIKWYPDMNREIHHG